MMSTVIMRDPYQSQPFDQLGEKYLLRQEVGRTQASFLYKAVEKTTGRAVAIKVFRRKFSVDPRFALNFRNHMRRILELENDHLVSILDYGMADGHYYIASEWINGQDLGSYLAQAGPFGELQAIAITSQVCQALEVVHGSGLLHQNLKPQNILLTSGGQVKLSDVGLSSLISESGLSRTHVVLGRYHYIAPEQVSGQDLTPGADIYSLGVILYEMLTGQFPFEGRDVWDVLRMHVEFQVPPLDQNHYKISSPLAEIVKRSLQKSPEERFPSANAMKAALMAVIMENIPPQTAFGSTSRVGIMDKLKHMLQRSRVFVQKPAPFRVFGKSYPFGGVLLIQFAISLLIGFLFFSVIFGLINRIQQNRSLAQGPSGPPAETHLLQKSMSKTKLLKPDNSSLVIPRAYQLAASCGSGVNTNLPEAGPTYPCRFKSSTISGSFR